MRLRSASVWIFMLASLLILGGCASQPQPVPNSHLPGFWLGLWHGFTAAFALIGHLFDSKIRIYAFPNNGGWYDLGYLLGLGALGGGGAASSR
jgi:hypothetical protein